MIMDGVWIMLIGMAVVFVMLLIIVLVVPLSGKIIRRLERGSSRGVDRPEGETPSAGNEKNPGTIAAIISAAVSRFKGGD